ncbi:MAG TPA: CBS domain-containing protein, partial [Candidatus Polarisedimenticolia bacterium]|nr:CBS domain-containing protein [Candidatus Polarisedimenticolia bacterium]
ITVREDLPVGELCDLLQANNINGAPVVDEQGYLLGVVTQEDIIYGAMGSPAGKPAEPAGRGLKSRGKRVMEMLRGRGLASVPMPKLPPGEIPFWADARRPHGGLGTKVSAIMTSPAISADESTPIADLCRIMWNLRIHRVPILRHGKVTGLVSSMDLCRAILTGKISA